VSKIRICGDDVKKFIEWADKNQISHSRENYSSFIDVELASADIKKWTCALYGISPEELKQVRTKPSPVVKEKPVSDMSDFIAEIE